jgi:hypothetical protein
MIVARATTADHAKIVDHEANAEMAVVRMDGRGATTIVRAIRTMVRKVRLHRGRN